MHTDFISWAAAALILFAAAAIMTERDWRVGLGALGAQYLAAFWLATRHLPFIIGSAKLITGWMVIAILGMTRAQIDALDDETSGLPHGRFFGFIFTGVIVLVAAGASVQVEAFVPGLEIPVIVGSLLLITAGILQLALTSDILRAMIGLLSMLAGFEIMYAAVENSILVAGLLAVVNLGLALSGAYLLLAGSLPAQLAEEEQ
ncbi:MAG: hypothetical protein Fur002_18850 [Anaerolineales bacterium]